MAIIAVALPVATWSAFDYWSPDGVAATIGSVVRVALGRRKIVGVVVGVNDASKVAPEKLQPVDACIDTVPVLPADVMELARFVSRYYQQPLGLVLSQMIPPLAMHRRAPPDDDGNVSEAAPRGARNAEQSIAVEAITSS